VNIIFDLGGVVVRWEPETIIASLFEDKKVRATVRTGVFEHADWLELDRGTLSRRDAIARAAARTGLPESEIDRLFRQVPLSLVPIPGTVDLLYRLKERGHSLYVLSNMHAASIEHIESAHTFWALFAGKVISCRVHLIKPEETIYYYLLQEYALTAEESIFIDDMAVNLEAAARVGIQTIRFENPEQCEECLRELNCI
jgi:putative hydrolase of the HAD superfamily